jgi:hypothetical protein
MAFIKLHSIISSLATIFLIGLCNEKRKCRSPRCDASIGALCSRGNRHCADREFSFSDLALIALAPRKSRKITKRLARGSREPSRWDHVNVKKNTRVSMSFPSAAVPCRKIIDERSTQEEPRAPPSTLGRPTKGKPALPIPQIWFALGHGGRDSANKNNG